jgi:hypothetical protein
MVGDAAVAAAEAQDLDVLVKDDPVGDARAVVQRMGVVSVRQQGGELVPEGFEDRWRQGRCETSR